MAKEWKCKDCCYFETDACPYLYMEEHYYKSCNSLVVDHNKAYQQGRADKYQEIVSEYMLLTEEQVAEIRDDAIDDCIAITRKGLKELCQSPYAERHYPIAKECFEIVDDLILKKDLEQLKEHK